MRRSARVVLAAGAILLAHVPAFGQAGWEPPAGRKCDRAFAEFRVPSLEEAADSAALLRDLESYLSAPGGRPELIALRVDYEKSGVVKRMEFDDDVPKEDQRTLNRTFKSHLKVLPAQQKAYSVGLRITGGPAPRVRLLPVTVTCPPALKNGQFILSLFGQEAALLANDGHLDSVRRRQVTLRMRVTRAGEPRDMAVIQSSGIPAVDQAALRTAVAMQFQPAILGREPVDVWVKQPINFAVERAPR